MNVTHTAALAQPPAALRASPDGSLLLVGCGALSEEVWSGQLTIFDASTLTLQDTVSAASGVTDLAWLDGERFLSAYDDGGVYLSRFDRAQCAGAGAPPAAPAGRSVTVEAAYLDHEASATAVAVSSGATHFASASTDGTVRFWDVASPAASVPSFNIRHLITHSLRV